ncbi:MAG: hypothetical protein PHX43_00530 [Alphaproteobacteria bacterium]|nr:hypothetical protein [Alphaproteobacteria bacterium]
MFDFNTSYKNYDEPFIQDNALSNTQASILLFPYKASGITPATSGDDVIDRRMQAPLSSNEVSALWDMVKYRAKHLQQEIWVATGMFLTAMGVEEMNDLSRCDFVRSVEYLVRLDSAQPLGAN